MFIGLSTLRTRVFPLGPGYIMLTYGIVEIVFTVSIIEIAIPFALLFGVCVFLVLGVSLLREQQTDLPAQETA